jgi:hypothetical protein
MIRINSSGKSVVWFRFKTAGLDTSRNKITIPLDLWLANAKTMEREPAFLNELFKKGVIEPMDDLDWDEIGVTRHQGTGTGGSPPLHPLALPSHFPPPHQRQVRGPLGVASPDGPSESAATLARRAPMTPIAARLREQIRMNERVVKALAAVIVKHQLHPVARRSVSAKIARARLDTADMG